MSTAVPRTSDDVRAAFLGFFEERGHQVLPGWPLVPIGDPTSLFTSAGMQQFKPYFTGDAEPPRTRLTTVQRCFRTTDIEEVGDLSHCTAFEMLGNFSFGDYSKQGAIEFAWDLLTRVLEIPPERLHITIYLTDDEAHTSWRSLGVPESHIHRCDEDKNYWFSFPPNQPGASGPCGPDSEIYFDHFPERGTDGIQVAYDDERFLEIWNLVFMELYQDPDGTRRPLPKKNIDTGSGLERLAAVQQGKRSVFETDIFLPILEAAASVAGIDYFGDGASDSQRYAIRAMAEHCRAAALLIGDGVVPSNEGRGYVLRRIIRRAVYFARSTGVTERFTARLAEAAIAKLAAAYPHLEERRDFIQRALDVEEERFSRTLTAGTSRLDELLERLSSEGHSKVPGQDAFRLYDTFGFPLELVREIAGARDFSVDDDGFEAAMDEQRQRSRQHGRLLTGDDSQALQSLGSDHSLFVGYERIDGEGQIVGLIKDGAPRDPVPAGEECDVVLTATPFYPEGGGQVGDRGTLRSSTGSFIVMDTRPEGGAIVHRGRVVDGELRVGQEVDAAVDFEFRIGSARNHTGTHLLHAGLRAILGHDVGQQGSYVGPDRLRFDFTYLEQTPREALIEVGQLVNEKVRRNLEVRWRRSSFRQAVADGALAFFEDKYGDDVRVVEISDHDEGFSAELCGGTHVAATGELGFIHVLRESAVAAGTRRIEALTGSGAEAYLMEQQAILDRVSSKLSTSPPELEARIETIQAEMERLKKQSLELEHLQASAAVDNLISGARTIGDASLVVGRVEAMNQDVLKDIADRVRSRLKTSLTILVATPSGRPSFLVAATPDLVDRGVNAGNLVREIAKAAGGGGGGRPDLALAGSRDASKVDEAMTLAMGLGDKALNSL